MVLLLNVNESPPFSQPSPDTETWTIFSKDQIPKVLQEFSSISSCAGNVTEIPFVDESSERELLSLLGDWYEPESIESLFSTMPSDAVFFSLLCLPMLFSFLISFAPRCPQRSALSVLLFYYGTPRCCLMSLVPSDLQLFQYLLRLLWPHMLLTVDTTL